MIARGDALPDVLDGVCRLVEDSLPGCLCSILLVDSSGARLESGAAPSLPPSYNAALHGRPVQPGAGPCGMAASTGQRVLAIDVDRESRWPEWGAVAAAHGLRACWSTPIQSADGAMLGTFAVYWRRPARPGAEHEEVISRMTHLTSVALDRKRSEGALNQVRSDLAHVARVATLGEMAASIAHEINQPLGAIVNNASASLRWLAANNFEEARRSMAQVVADGHRASGILDRIRAMVRKSPPQKSPVDVEDALREVLTLLAGQAAAARVRIEWRPSGGIPHVRADRVQVQQVVLNLVVNAIEAMSDTPEEMRRLTIAVTTDGSAVQVSVRDQGAGYPPEQPERLFEAFYSTKRDGLGLGLAISRAIVHAHHGQLCATLNADRGATFAFTLPVSEDIEW